MTAPRLIAAVMLMVTAAAVGLIGAGHWQLVLRPEVSGLLRPCSSIPDIADSLRADIIFAGETDGSPIFEWVKAEAANRHSAAINFDSLSRCQDSTRPRRSGPTSPCGRSHTVSMFSALGCYAQFFWINRNPRAGQPTTIFSSALSV